MKTFMFIGLILFTTSSIAGLLEGKDLECRPDGDYGIILEDEAIYIDNGNPSYWDNDSLTPLGKIGENHYAIGYENGSVFSALFSETNGKIEVSVSVDAGSTVVNVDCTAK